MAGYSAGGIGAGIKQELRPAQPGGEAMEGGEASGEEASPEEEALAEQAIENATTIIYPPNERGQMSSKIAASLAGDFGPEVQQLLGAVEPPVNPDAPIDCIAATAAMVCMMVDDSAQQSGVEIEAGMLMQIGMAVTDMLASDGEEAGIFTVSDEEAEYAYYRAVDIFRQVSPRVDQDALKADFEEIRQADEAGQLEKVLPGIGQARREEGGEP